MRLEEHIGLTEPLKHVFLNLRISLVLKYSIDLLLYRNNVINDERPGA